ncbi:MAG: hypothetical protein ACTS9Y_00590 [Methylophilus sp.]|uniref:hypothetical protein n=1 Tax=Methylophilus sp. TaxID=29541 RepID=UPI003FA01508
MLDKNTSIYIIDDEHRIYRTKVGMFLDINEVKVLVNGQLQCRHSIIENDGEWFLTHRNGAGKVVMQSKAVTTYEMAQEKLFNARLEDIDELYIAGHRPTFYTDLERLVDYIVVEFDKHTQSKVLTIHSGAFGYDVERHMEYRLGEAQLQHNLANYEQTIQLQEALKEHDAEIAGDPVKEAPILDPELVYQFDKTRAQLFVVKGELYFQGLLVKLEYPKVSSQPSGPLFQRGLDAGMSENEAGKLYHMGYKVLELAITRN